MIILAYSLEKDIDAASMWLRRLMAGQSDVRALRNAFPMAPPDAAHKAFLAAKGSFLLAYRSMAKTHPSAWGMALVAPTVGALALGDEDEEFTSATQEHATYKDKWWESLLSSRSHGLGIRSEHSEQWVSISRACMSRMYISPRVHEWVYKLGGQYSDPSTYEQAIEELSTLPSFRKCQEYAMRHDASLAVVSVVEVLI